VFTPPSRAALPIFTDDDSKPHAGATLAILATLTQIQHAIAQFVACYPSPWGRCWGHGDRLYGAGQDLLALCMVGSRAPSASLLKTHFRCENNPICG
jgi:hypothetical protein